MAKLPVVRIYTNQLRVRACAMAPIASPIGTRAKRIEVRLNCLGITRMRQVRDRVHIAHGCACARATFYCSLCALALHQKPRARAPLTRQILHKLRLPKSVRLSIHALCRLRPCRSSSAPFIEWIHQPNLHIIFWICIYAHARVFTFKRACVRPSMQHACI